jgi:signal transduction histidine kinase
MISQIAVNQAAPAQTRFCSSLAQGIHAAAQPLTVLLASLSKAHTDPMNTDELRQLTASSAVEVQRVCTLFSSLQQMVMAECIKPQLTSLPVLPLLTFVTEGVELLFRESGIPFHCVLPDVCPPAFINSSRTTQALSRVLLVVHALTAGGGGPVELTASSSADAVHVVVSSHRTAVGAITPENNLSLAVAEANMRSQQAGYSMTLQPFTVRIDLPRS